jgi:(p)ppGpp synthase/HD superfamily hydrolase
MKEKRQANETVRNKLFKWVKKQHEGQYRKYTQKPYYTHLENVALMCIDLHYLAYEIGICHDLIEDTDITITGLFNKLIELGYTYGDAMFVKNRVKELTDVYTLEDYPEYNRQERKQKEIERLSHIHELSASIKYADIVDNTKDIIPYDPDFGLIYLKEKKNLLSVVRYGDFDLYALACHLLIKGETQLLLNTLK